MKPIDLPIAGGDVAAIVVQPWFCNLDWVKQKKTQTQLLCNSLAGPHYQWVNRITWCKQKQTKQKKYQKGSAKNVAIK